MRSLRLQEMENYIFEKNTVTLDELCSVFNVSKNTVRRDIEQIMENTKIQKIYGGVTAESAQRNDLHSFEERSRTKSPEKETIAREASTMIEDGDIIYVDSGTTTSHMIPFIVDKHITILTNNLEVMLACMPHDNIQIISLGGMLRRKTFCFISLNSENIANEFKLYNINKAFMAASSVSVATGASNSSLEEIAIKRAALDNSQHHYLLAEHSKFGLMSLFTYGQLDEFDIIFTDEKPDENTVQYLEEHKVKLVCPVKKILSIGKGSTGAEG